VETAAVIADQSRPAQPLPGPDAGIGRFSGADGVVFLGAVLGQDVVPLGTTSFGMGGDDPAVLFGQWDRLVAALATWSRTGPPPGVTIRPLRELAVHPPVSPERVFQSGANYRTHVIDLIVAQKIGQHDGEDPAALRARAAEAMDARAARGTPYVFLGLPSAITGSFDDVVLPARGTEHDWELELGVVIGRPAYRVHRDQALEHVAGYTIVNDVTTRDLVFRPDVPGIGTDWLASKNAPTFSPTGPFLVPAAFVDPAALRVRLRLNGEVMQDGPTSDMIFDVARLVEHTSAITELRPGDLLMTGSPAGNGAHHGRFLRPGDVMEGEITGLGTQRNRCVGERA
jgi:2-keto-4-pentenoate hydratase/2-oxohepta-3-ene-1,7-dioic acid hydratase in catechol pathway